MNLLVRAALIGAIGVVAALTAGALLTAPAAHAAVGGPVIIGGDDLTDHGCNDGEGTNQEGWLYLQRALENIDPSVTKANDGSIAALGSEDVAGEIICDDAGSAIYHAAAAAGLTVNYYEGAPAITQFFTDLAGGTVTPAIIWISGDGASNDLNFDEATALTANAQGISDFVSAGGGLMSHGSEYGWLFALLPGASAIDDGSSDDLYFTADGLAELPALSQSDINAGPWHNYFEGDLGGLKVLVRSGDLDDTTGADAAVIIGGAQVTFEEQPEDEPDPTATPCIPPLIGYRCDGTSGGGGGGGAQPTTVPPTAVVPVATAAPGTAVAGSPVAATPTSTGGRLGVITAPDTGDGSGTAGGDSATMLLVALAGVGLALAMTGAVARARRGS